MPRKHPQNQAPEPAEGQIATVSPASLATWLGSDLAALILAAPYPDRLRRVDTSGLLDLQAYWNFPYLMRLDIKRRSHLPLLSPIYGEYRGGNLHILGDYQPTEEE